jgi:hypothetical protein
MSNLPDFLLVETATQTGYKPILQSFFGKNSGQ